MVGRMGEGRTNGQLWRFLVRCCRSSSTYWGAGRRPGVGEGEFNYRGERDREGSRAGRTARSLCAHEPHPESGGRCGDCPGIPRIPHTSPCLFPSSRLHPLSSALQTASVVVRCRRFSFPRRAAFSTQYLTDGLPLPWMLLAEGGVFRTSIQRNLQCRSDSRNIGSI